MFGAYVRENRKVVIALAVYTAVFAFIFWLYRLPLGAVGYAALVCLFLLLVWLAVDYRRFAVRLRLLRRLEQYVEMVLGYLRLESPSSDYVIRNYALDDIVRQVVRKYASQFIRRRLRLEYTPLNVSVITDEKWLLFVIEQVLSNALKYTRSGSVSITLEAPKTLCIRDTGIGIAPEDLPRVFEKGFTGCNGRTDKRATGIGLYLCRRILEKLGHTIAITSTVGEGTTVRIGLQQDALEVE